jgi:PA domain
LLAALQKKLIREIPFIDKARNCERSSAVAAIIVNNVDDIFRGTLGFNNVTGKPNTARIPMIGVTTIDGQTLLSTMGEKVRFFYPLEGGAFGYQNGTSMA